ncbi:1-acyl-sn-glycerol-3-phosphate acyltransferase BAT2, chloroplastic-like isoform X3 [Musa acuminata AAA Group]|uniref:1-acyl-sn-glycerol-3-phosphate acyltransferase BAT2, chloroplastic isoform X3 n=1 Tax=Musa acuminata AAA Group TaxID=214697 RepID=UPI0031D27A0B
MDKDSISSTFTFPSSGPKCCVSIRSRPLSSPFPFSSSTHPPIRLRLQAGDSAMGTMTRSLLGLKTLPSFAPLNCGPASRNAVSSPEFQMVPRIRGICFYSVTAVAAIFLFAVMVVVHPFVVLFDRYRRRAHHLIAKIWATMTIVPFYKFEFEGMENLPPQGTPVVYVSNHQSFLDIYTLLTLGRSFKFISKRSIFLFPIIGWAMFLMGVIPLRRMDSRSRLDCFKRCMEFVKKGASVFFFPEGTRSKDGMLGAFKKGAFSVAAKAGVPVVPITLIGTGKIMPPGKEGILNSGSVKVVIHKTLDGKDADKLCNEARDAIARTLLLHGYGVH